MEYVECLPSIEPETPSNGSITSMNTEKMHDRTMDGLIRRQDAKDAIDMALDHIDHVPPWVYDKLLNVLNEVPSVGEGTTFEEDATKDATSDLISRKGAIEAVEFGITYAKAINKSTGEVKELFKEGNKALNEAVERLKELPSAEPEIIRCKDCKYWISDGCKEVGCLEDDFCSYAERRGEEDEN